MTNCDAIERLTDRQVTLILQHLSAETLPADAAVNGLANQAEGTELLTAFVAGAGQAPSAEVSPGEGSVPSLARSVVEFALNEPTTRALAEDLVMEPPDDDQLGVAEISEVLASLGFLVAFLQTRFEFKVSRKEGKTLIEAAVTKEALKEPLMEKVLSIAQNLISGGPGHGT